ncbi:MAG: hypothetical protein JJU05_09350 [Verrucomicrobia bacterium]|nr:hypothetical protein [Verrucomicrobiota bacterium]
MTKRITSTEARKRGYCSSEVAKIEFAEEGQREADNFLALIDKTFGSIPKPKVTQLVAQALDDEWNLTEERVNELSKADPETDWREVSKEKTTAYQEYFSFSNSAGVRFYLPAYMSHYLSEFPNYGFDAVYWACVSKMNFDDLTEEELKIVDKFVELCNKYERT